jgi:hypothetical protein
MKRTRIGVGVAVAGLATALAAAQYDNPGQPPPRRAEVPNAGFWPTQRMLESAIERITEELGKVYSLDEDQMLNTQDVLKQRFPRWMEENRPQLQTLTNEWFEAMIASEPPTPERVADWASRARPLFDQFGTLVDDTTDDMRTFMTDDQQVLLDGQLAAMRVGMNYMKQRMDTWKEGGYDWQTEWPRSDEFKRQEPARRERLHRDAELAKNRAMGLPTDVAEGPVGGAPAADAPPPAQTRPGTNGAKDDWTIYVENFIKRYQLDEPEQNKARQYLRDGQELRDKHLQRKLAEIKTLEEKQKIAKTDEEREQVRVAVERVNRPVEQIFQRLKDKLEKLPTRKQRALAAQADENSGAAQKATADARNPAGKGPEPAQPKPDSGAKE